VLRSETKVWTSKYLNNVVEQDHRRVKQRLYPMLGFKNFRNAAVTVGGLELAQKIRKGQFDTAALISRDGTGVPRMWEVALAA
jgi:transposase-like protein